MNEYTESNRRHWDEITPVHAASDFYDVASFKAGKSKLKPVELEELGHVRGKTLLHLQCHFGLDTLSWAREGATVTGIDFSEPAIETARSLAAETGIDAHFVVSDFYALPEKLQGQFDIVLPRTARFAGYRTSRVGHRWRRTSSGPAAHSTSPNSTRLLGCSTTSLT